jgi:NADH-quinone oxidoreductase subunit N
MAPDMLAALWMPSLEELTRLGPLFALIGTVVAVLLAALAVGRNWRVSGGLSAVGAFVAAWLCVRGWRGLEGNWAGMSPAAGAPMLVADQFGYFFIFLLSVFLMLITGMWLLGVEAGSPDAAGHKRHAAEFFVLLVGSAFGMALMVSTTNLLMIILAVEMASLPSYALAGFRKTHRLAAEASLKYILFGAVTSATMVYGASLLYGRYHTLDLLTIGRALAEQPPGAGPNLLLGVALVAFIIGVAFKISAVPFHFWCPDVFQGASIEITTWLSVASKAAGLGLLLRIVTAITAPLSYAPAALGHAARGYVSSADSISYTSETLHYVTWALAAMAAITCTIGNLSAYRQTNLKRLLAFSSIAHAGYMLMVVVVVWHPMAIRAEAAHPGFSALAFYLAVYLLMNVGAFGCVALVYWATGDETIGAFNGLARRHPLLAVAMTVCLFSLVGLPPMGGFFAKWYLLAALYESGVVGILLVLVAVANTLISLYYYARIAYAMCFVDDGRPTLRAPILGQAVVLACAALLLLTGTLWAGKLKRFADDRSRDLYAVVQPTTTIRVAEPGTVGDAEPATAGTVARKRAE